MKRSIGSAGLILLIVSGESFAQTVKPEVTFAEHVAPIIRQNCTDCHHPDGIGPFSLTTYEQTSRRARQIAEVVASRYMPPWKPNPDVGPPLIGERRLTDQEINVIRRWYEAGSPSGDLEILPAPEKKPGSWLLGDPDIILEFEGDYRLPAEGGDIYRNFILHNPLDSPQYVRAFALNPQTKLAIHHALLTVDGTGESRRLDARDPGPGWEGMEIGGDPPAGHILGWTPGQRPYEAYPGTAWQLHPDQDLILQLHLLPTGRLEAIRPQIGLYFTDEPPDLSSYVFQLRNYDISIPAGEADYRVRSALTLPVPVMVVSVYPHAHYLGNDIRLFSTLPDGSRKWLLHIPDWDFNWQGDYRFAEPVSLPAGATLEMDYRYDNSEGNPRNPHSPPLDVTGGFSSFDEMAEAMFQVIPDKQETLSRLVEVQLQYHYRTAGGEGRYHYLTGIAFEQQGAYEEAAAAYRAALRAEPELAEAYYRLGGLLELEGEFQQAMDRYQEALAWEPDLTVASLALAKVHIRTNRPRLAQFILEDLYLESPDNLEVVLELARLHGSTADTDRALAILKDAETRFAEAPRFFLEYGRLLMATGGLEEAEAQLRKCLDLLAKEKTAAATPSEKEGLEATGYYYLAEVLKADARTQEAQAAVSRALELSPSYLHALMLAAQLALETAEHARAKAHLIRIVSRPEEQTFPYPDLVNHLPLPEGGRLLAEAYRSAGKDALARESLEYAAERLREMGQPEAIPHLQENPESSENRSLLE